MLSILSVHKNYITTNVGCFKVWGYCPLIKECGSKIRFSLRLIKNDVINLLCTICKGNEGQGKFDILRPCCKLN